jgi:hypothetical protein
MHLPSASGFDSEAMVAVGICSKRPSFTSVQSIVVMLHEHGP